MICTDFIVSILCSQLPQDARLVELYLAAAGLGRFLGTRIGKSI